MELSPELSEVEILGLTADSRAVRPGYLFAALPGRRADGRAYIADAVARGAVAVLAPPGVHFAAREIAVVTDSNPRRRLSLAAARFFGRQPRAIAAVTGTNGKSSVVSFTRQIWTALGHGAASIGTLGLVAPGLEDAQNLTTPDPVALHETLARLAASGVERVALEASSHGLDQFRLDGVRVTLAAFTNLSRDHLDYHRSMESYRAAKLRLFGEVMEPGGRAALNADSDEYDAFAAACVRRGHRIVGYGRRGGEVRLEAAEAIGSALEVQRIRVAVGGSSYPVAFPLVGGFQVMNALCALALVIADGAEASPAIAALEQLQGVRGRLERVRARAGGGAIYVDYAHTPDALATALNALRPHTKSRLMVVFGCGGDRDRGKRPEMGAVAARLADEIIVTDDNPRSENPALIRREVLAGCPRAEEVGDRAEAIRRAVRALGPGDVLLIAGKGHERNQILADRVIPFDDVSAAAQAAAEVEGRG